MEHLRLKRKIKSISKDTNKFSIERGGQVEEKGSRSSSRGSRKNFFDRQLIKERNEIGPNLRQKYKLDVARKETLLATTRNNDLRQQMKENFVVIFPDPQL